MKRIVLITIALAFLAAFPVFAGQKSGMPDFRQVDNTCFPTSAANLMYWFGKNGYPALIPPDEASQSSGEKLVLRLIISSKTTFKQGTEFRSLADGLSAYITQCGYKNAVEYHGLGSLDEFFLNELEHNSSATNGYILCLGLYGYNKDHMLAPYAHENHCVTLVEYNPDYCVVLDPAHKKGQIGKTTLSFRKLGICNIGDTHGNVDTREVYEVLGMDEQPPNTICILLGAIHVSLFPRGATAGP